MQQHTITHTAVKDDSSTSNLLTTRTGLSSIALVQYRGVLVVSAIAVTHVGATQMAAWSLRMKSDLAPLFLVWLSTGWNLLLGLPFHAMLRNYCGALPRCSAAAAAEPWLTRRWVLLLAVFPFFILWAGANGLYIQALKSLPSSLVLAVFSVTPALVALLGVPLLRRRVSLIAALAVLLSGGGVAVLARPWNGAASAASGSLTIGVLEVLGAACCAASYKVLFKRIFGDAPAALVLAVLCVLGLWSVTFGTAALALFDIKSLQQMGAISREVWVAIFARCLLDVLFNFFIALGLALTHPLFISVGTLLSTPLNVLVELVWHGTIPAPPEAVGIAAICGGFAAIMYDDYKRDIVNNALAPAAESPVAARGETESLDRSAQT